MSLVKISARNRKLKAVDSLIVGLTEKASTPQSLCRCSANKTESPRNRRVYLERIFLPLPYTSRSITTSHHTLYPRKSRGNGYLWELFLWVMGRNYRHTVSHRKAIDGFPWNWLCFEGTMVCMCLCFNPLWVYVLEAWSSWYWCGVSFKRWSWVKSP